MARRSSKRDSGLEAPYLRRVWLDAGRIADRAAYPFCLPFLGDDFELSFDASVTIIVGENGVGKSTLIEGIAAVAGFDRAGGGKGYGAVEHTEAAEVAGDVLGEVLNAAWRPKVSYGWFFRAESFFTVARYLDDAARGSGAAPPDYLSHSHGEGFLRFFAERCSRQGIYFFDEPESALSPARQIEFLKILARLQASRHAQVVMATHAPILMALPGARLLRMTSRGIAPVTLEETDHFRLMREFCAEPTGFIAERLAEEQ